MNQDHRTTFQIERAAPLQGMKDRVADRLTANPYHADDLRVGEPAAMLVDAEVRVARRLREIYEAWLADADPRALSRLAGAVVVVGRAQSRGRRCPADVLARDGAASVTDTLRALVLRAEAIGRGDEQARRRTLRAVAELATELLR